MVSWLIAGLIVWALCILFMLAILRGGHRIRGHGYNSTGKRDQSTISRFADKYEIRRFIRKVPKTS